MAPHTTVQIKGQRLYEDDAFIVLKKNGPFGIEYPLLSSFYVFIKHSKAAVKATGREKRFLLATISELVRIGFPMSDVRKTDLLRDFADAIAGRGGARWVMFFQQKTSRETALRYGHH